MRFRTCRPSLGAHPDHLVGNQRLGGAAHRHHLRPGKGSHPHGRRPRAGPAGSSAERHPGRRQPYPQAVTAGWIIAGTGADQQIQQWEFDRGMLRVIGLRGSVTADRPLRPPTSGDPKLPFAFGIEQAVQRSAARSTPLTGRMPGRRGRARRCAGEPGSPGLAARSPQLLGASNVTDKTAVRTRCRHGRRCKKGARDGAPIRRGPVRVGGRMARPPQSPYGTQAAGGFDCSGFVWWVMKEHTYTPPGFTWSGNAPSRPAAPMTWPPPCPSKRIRSNLQPGDIVSGARPPRA